MGDSSGYADEVRRDVAELVRPLVAGAEHERRFPRAVIERLGAAGHFRRRWEQPGPYGDVSATMTLSRELGRLLAGGITAGVSLHADSALSLLRSASTDEARDLLDDGIAGRAVYCIGVTEPTGGSDVAMLQTSARPTSDGRWCITGRKKFISLARTADVALVLARTGEAPGHLTFFAVPNGVGGYVVERDLVKHGTHGIETCELSIDDVVAEPSQVVGRVGGGLALFARAMTAERLALCAQLAGALDAALEIARGYLRERALRDGTLWDLQALRHRFADLLAEATVLGAAITHLGGELQAGRASHRQLAALKLSVAPRVERALSEVLQLLGGTGYTDEFPIERGLRDARLARIGAGTDDVMREMVAETGMADDAYRAWLDERAERARLESTEGSLT